MIFYLEDDENIRNLTVYTLEQTGHQTVGFSYARDMYEALGSQMPDMFILDVMLPDEDGFTVLHKLRSRADTANVPVMMLTAKGSEFDKVTGLDAGADDYMTKPFGMMELVSRVNALFRRCARGGAAGEAAEAADAAEAARADGAVPIGSADVAGREHDGRIAAANEEPAHDALGDSADLLLKLDAASHRQRVLEAGPIRLDISRYEVTVDSHPVHLTRKEFQMLAFLMANKGIVVTRGQLLDRVWGYSVAGQTRTVDAHMQTLRKKLSEIDPSVHDLIETVRGVGYKMVG